MEEIADGVWKLAKGFPLRINVYFVREGDGVAVFDAGNKQMGKAIREAADELGGATRVIIGNAHPDHRGGAKAVGAPIHCHADERSDLEGDGGLHYFDYDALGIPGKWITPPMMGFFDDGPLEVAGTVAEGDAVGEFEVIHLPGHGPGCIGLWRESDRLAITNDCFALFNPDIPREGEPRIPHPAFNWSTDAVRDSIRKLAAMEPASCWPGHYGPVDTDVRGKLEAAASA